MLFRSIGRLGIPVLAFFLWGVTAPASPQPDAVEQIAQRYPTPELFASFLKKRVVFREDIQLFGREDYWQGPEEFLNRGAGDCEDYALLAEEVLKRQGKKAFVLSLYGEGGYAHTVCVFMEEGRYQVINQDRVIRYGAKSLEELANDLYPRWVWGAVACRAGTRGRAVQRITSEARLSPSVFPSTAGR